jgi:hypothetical protein
MKGMTGAAMVTRTGNARANRDARRRRREEAAWAARSGPVTVRYVEPQPRSRTNANSDGNG